MEMILLPENTIQSYLGRLNKREFDEKIKEENLPEIWYNEVIPMT